MKNLKRIRLAGAVTLAPALLAWACVGSGDGVSGPTLGISAPADVAGSWVGSWQRDIDDPEIEPALAAGAGSVRLSLLQFGRVVTGTAEFTGVLGSRPAADCLEHASVAGLVDAHQISLRLTNGTPALEGRLEGQLQGGSLSGRYADACIPSATLALRRE